MQAEEFPLITSLASFFVKHYKPKKQQLLYEHSFIRCRVLQPSSDTTIIHSLMLERAVKRL